MGSITARPRSNGTVRYTAQVRIVRGGKSYSEAQTFDTERAAGAWLTRREKELAKPGALEIAMTPSETLGDAIDRYLGEMGVGIGRTKAQVLKAIKAYDIAAMKCVEIGSADIVAFARELSKGRSPQTVQNYLSHLAAVVRVARSAWGFPLDRNVMLSAMEAAKHLGLTSRSRERSRRPSLAEMNALMDHFERRHASTPMTMIAAFAMFSTRRQEEITRIRWDDLEAGRVLVRAMKHPGQKRGNDVWCELPPEAERVVNAVPRTAPEIFPYKTDAISAAFTRACAFLRIEDLHFHDLRHEGVSRLFEMGRTIPQAASVSGHRSWASLQRYAHIRQVGDKWEGWPWLDRIAPEESA